MKLRNLYLALKDQGPLPRFLRNLWKGHVFGLGSKRSHVNANGKPKIAYGSKESATRAAQSMMKKTGNYFSNYKCIWCDGYHIGKNSDNKGPGSARSSKDLEDARNGKPTVSSGEVSASSDSAQGSR